MFYRKNLPVWERGLRSVMGLGMLGFAIWGMPASTISYALMAGGITAVLTGFVGFCPMCAMVGRKLN